MVLQSYNDSTTLEHSGTKGMKWGVRKIHNAMTSKAIQKNSMVIQKNANKLGTRLAAENVAKHISGNGLSAVRTVTGTAIHKYAMKGIGKDTKSANLHNFSNNKQAVNAIRRNQKFSNKLASKYANATGTKKEKLKKNLDAWNAYSKSYSKRVTTQLAESNKHFERSDKNRINIDKVRNATIKNINTGVYKGNRHGDTNQVLDSQYDTAKKMAKKTAEVAKSISPAQVKAVVGAAGYVSGRAARSAVDGANYVKASAKRKNVKAAYKDQSTRYKTI